MLHNVNNFFISSFVNTVDIALWLPKQSNITSVVSVSWTEVNNGLTSSNDTVMKPRSICSFFIFPITPKVLLMVQVDCPKGDKFSTKYFAKR